MKSLEQKAPWQKWGDQIDPNAEAQMEAASRLPVAVAGALMPDAHVGYGLPIGGVLATRNAVIPYAVGVDIACRMKMTVLDLPLDWLERKKERLIKAIEEETRFGVGAEFRQRRDHPVMEADWSVSPVTRQHRDRAWAQLGTSGSGNHFVEFGILTVFRPVLLDPDTRRPVQPQPAEFDSSEKEGRFAILAPGRYLALLSHSGSRGTGASVCDYYSKLAMKKRPDLPKDMRHLAWLDLDEDDGREYWAAMELMGRYAAANHELIHTHIARNLGVSVLFDLENHHNFAWKERHLGQELVVHRKGATPAGEGVMGIIPGSMASPGFVVRGKGNPDSLNSAAHGAGRCISRTKAEKTFSWKEAKKVLEEAGVTLISAGLDEVPMVYKDIRQVMAAQSDLVEVVAQFDPKLVKMAPSGERPED
ncbi:MAG: RtcB family protein [Kiritimatiellae bacterium]|nr:RtcB family protein [Kiritimatiellia bacterium]MDW8459371.1 RtcB family protein [Verrucomicrobiota bacterium]